MGIASTERGKFEFPDGKVYEGTFRYLLPDGQGAFTIRRDDCRRER
jgi:hypothetical protein